MNMRKIITLAILVLLLASCARPEPTTSPAQATALPAVEAGEPAESTPKPDREVPSGDVPAAPLRGPGAFDLSDMPYGLNDLPRYQAVLRMVFDGTRDGQPYHIEKTYDRLVDQSMNAQLLVESGTRADGSSYQVFSGLVGAVRYGQPAPDQPCQVGQAAPQGIPFNPASLLPKLLGAQAAGQETVENIPAEFYTFDHLALGAGDGASASGKVWIAQQGGWIVKYELSLKSDVVFGEGITGEQRWSYIVRDPGEGAVVLPEGCPLPMTDVPVPDSAKDVIYLPNEVRFTIESGQESLLGYYIEQFTAQGFLQQGQAVDTPGGMRWVFGKREGDQAVIYILTAKPDETMQAVRLVRIVTEALPEQAQ